MVIAPHPKKRPTPAVKKRTGQHQKHTPHYLKTYWPYLPLLIVAAFTNALLDRHAAWRTGATMADVSRLQTWTHTGYSVTLTVAMLVIVCAAIIFTRHAKAWHKVVVKGEAFVLQHRMLDFVLALVVVSGVLVTKGL